MIESIKQSLVCPFSVPRIIALFIINFRHANIEVGSLGQIYYIGESHFDHDTGMIRSDCPIPTKGSCR